MNLCVRHRGIFLGKTTNARKKNLKNVLGCTCHHLKQAVLLESQGTMLVNKRKYICTDYALVMARINPLLPTETINKITG